MSDLLDATRQQIASLLTKAKAVEGRTDSVSLREHARCLIGVSYSADLLEALVPAERAHWHRVGTDAERQAAAALLVLAERRPMRRLQVVAGGRG